MKAFAAVVFACLLSVLAVRPTLADQEQQIGMQVYQQLMRKGEIIPNAPQYPGSSLYAALAPVAQRITAVVNPQYQYPFHFILVHERQPNAFSVPGGNVYVTDSLMHFVDNQEELAGVLCHETSHTIHHDVVSLINKDRNTELLGTLAQIFLSRGSYLASSGIGLVTNLQEQHFSRGVETAADLKGSETCAQAGFNPYGMVWLFRKFGKSGKGGTMEILSDHPSDNHRISDLENHIRSNPELFGHFSGDMGKATPIKLPVESAPQQGRPGPYGPGGPNGPNGGYGPGPGGYGGPYGGPNGNATGGQPNGRAPHPTPSATPPPSDDPDGE